MDDLLRAPPLVAVQLFGGPYDGGWVEIEATRSNTRFVIVPHRRADGFVGLKYERLSPAHYQYVKE